MFGKVRPSISGQGAILNELLAAPDQQQSNAEAIEALETIDDGEVDVRFAKRLRLPVGSAAAESSDLGLGHDSALNEVTDQSLVDGVGYMIERRTLGEVLVHVDAL